MPEKFSQKNMPASGTRHVARPPRCSVAAEAKASRWPGVRADGTFVKLAHVADVVIPARLAPVVEDLLGDLLGEGAGVQAGGLLVQLHLVNERLRASDPAQPEARGQDLGEAVEAKHSLVAVERQKGRGLSAEVQVVIGVVLVSSKRTSMIRKSFAEAH